MESFQVYKDMKARTNGEIYIGVVGPVRTGKSTFIKRFMDLLVLPNMTDIHAKERTQDELPQSASGTTIMTTEPKFVPKEAAGVKLSDDLEVKIRMIDCVGFMSEGASGHIEKDEERQVKTPWFEYEIPFTKAAAIGTQKVIRDHATIGIVVTTDGSVTDLPRENYIQAEERTVKELKAIGKPFMILLNCKKPYTEESKKLQEELREKYETAVLPVNCEQMKEEDIHEIMRQVLYEFPVTEVEFYVPKWVEMLSREHKIKQDLFEHVRKIMETMDDIRSVVSRSFEAEGPYIERILTEKIEMDTGKVQVKIEFAESYYYEVISEVTGEEIHGEYELMAVMKELSAMREEFSRIKDAFADVKMKGYGVVSPSKEDIRLEEPVIIKQGSKFAVCIDLDGVERCLKRIAFSCFCYGKRCFHSCPAYRTQHLISLGRQVFRINNGSIFRLLYRVHVRSVGQCLCAVCAKLYDIVSSVAQRIPYGHTLVLLRTECIQTLTDQFCRCFCNLRVFFLRLLIYLMDGGTRQNIVELIRQDHLPHAIQFFGRICFSGLFCQNGQKL